MAAAVMSVYFLDPANDEGERASASFRTGITIEMSIIAIHERQICRKESNCCFDTKRASGSSNPAMGSTQLELQLCDCQLAANHSEEGIDVIGDSIHTGCCSECDKSDHQGILDQILAVFPTQVLQFNKEIVNWEWQRIFSRRMLLWVLCRERKQGKFSPV